MAGAAGADKQRAIMAVKLMLVAGIFAWLYGSGRLDFAALGMALTETPGHVAASLALTLTAIAIGVERWRALLSAMKFSVGFGPALRLTLIGMFFSIALPGVVGGDIVKAYYLARGQSQKTALVTTVFFDRIAGLYTMFLMAALAGAGAAAFVWISPDTPGWWTPSIKGLVLFSIIAFAMSSVMALLFMSKRVGESPALARLIGLLPFSAAIMKIHGATKNFGREPGLMLRSLVFSIIAQLVAYASIWLMAAALKITELPFWQYLFALPVCALINSIPVAPSGLGVGEVGFGAVFAMFGSNKGVELAVLFHAVNIALCLVIGGLVYLSSLRGDSGVSIANLKNLEREEGNK
ncbi:MAG: flippase-like domain-containing protein [Nitrospinae bacterium]|nr:flippase-like domain-containing protein [Nitrospinota bacterium]